MTTKHTPGPWTVEKTGSSYVHVVTPTHVVAAISGAPGVSKYVVANGHLIAAAPDLLAACHAALSGYTEEDDHPIIELIRATIRKAEGGAT